MSIEQRAHAITRQETRGSVSLWFAILGSPLAWAGHLVSNYALEEWFACSRSATDRGRVLGLTVDAMSWTLTSVMASIAAAAGLTALLCWRKLRRVTNGDAIERAQWMAYAGMVEAVIFVAAIVLGYVPPALLDTCATSP